MSPVQPAWSAADAIVNLATHLPPSTARMLLPGAWRENDRLRRDAAAILATVRALPAHSAAA